MRSLAILLLAAAILCACQGEIEPIATATTPPTLQPTPTNSPAAVETSTVVGVTRTPLPKIAVTPDALKGVQVEFWHPWSGEMAKAVDAAVNEFNQTNIWGITVSAASLGSIFALDDAISNAAPGSRLPQVIAIPPEYIETYPGVIALDDYMEDANWGLTGAEKADFYPAFWNEKTPGAPRLSIPLLRSMAVLFYNQGWAKDLGFTQPPSAPSDFKAQVCAAGKAVTLTGNPDTNGTGGWIINTSSSTVYSWLAAYSAVPTQTPAAPQLYNNSSTVTAFSYLRKLFDANCAWSSRNPTPYIYFTGRQALLFSGTLEDLPALTAAMTFQKNTDAWKVLPYPTDNAQKTPITFGPSLAILKGSAEQQLASWLFVRWLELPRVQARLAASGPILPVRKSALDLMANFAKDNPQWAIAAGWLNGKTLSLPVQGWWKVTQQVLEDGAGQIFQPYLAVDKVPDVLKELDATVAELMKR